MNLNEITKKQQKVILYFTADWCEPCKLFAPIINKIKTEQTIHIEKINVDTDMDFAQELNVKAIPTIILFNNQKELKRLSGVQSEKTILESFY